MFTYGNKLMNVLFKDLSKLFALTCKHRTTHGCCMFFFYLCLMFEYGASNVDVVRRAWCHLLLIFLYSLECCYLKLNCFIRWTCFLKLFIVTRSIANKSLLHILLTALVRKISGSSFLPQKWQWVSFLEKVIAQYDTA